MFPAGVELIQTLYCYSLINPSQQLYELSLKSEASTCHITDEETKYNLPKVMYLVRSGIELDLKVDQLLLGSAFNLSF